MTLFCGAMCAVWPVNIDSHERKPSHEKVNCSKHSSPTNEPETSHQKENRCRGKGLSCRNSETVEHPAIDVREIRFLLAAKIVICPTCAVMGRGTSGRHRGDVPRSHGASNLAGRIGCRERGADGAGGSFKPLLPFNAPPTPSNSG